MPEFCLIPQNRNLKKKSPEIKIVSEITRCISFKPDKHYRGIKRESDKISDNQNGKWGAIKVSLREKCPNTDEKKLCI